MLNWYLVCCVHLLGYYNQYSIIFIYIFAGQFFLASLVLQALSTTGTVIVLVFHHRADHAARVPLWVKKFIFGIIAPIVGLKETVKNINPHLVSSCLMPYLKNLSSIIELCAELMHDFWIIINCFLKSDGSRVIPSDTKTDAIQDEVNKISLSNNNDEILEHLKYIRYSQYKQWNLYSCRHCC